MSFYSNVFILHNHKFNYLLFKSIIHFILFSFTISK